MTMNRIIIGFALICLFTIQAQAEDKIILITNVLIWDGTTDQLSGVSNVLIKGDEIAGIGVSEDDTPQITLRIDGGGRTLMPGLIDAHVHINYQFLDSSRGVPIANEMTWEELGIRSREAVAEYLPSGFTTVRDLCGTGVAMRKLIDSGFIEGPRMYISGACISQTSGHTDWRMDPPKLFGQVGKILVLRSWDSLFLQMVMTKCSKQLATISPEALILSRLWLAAESARIATRYIPCKGRWMS